MFRLKETVCEVGFLWLQKGRRSESVPPPYSFIRSSSSTLGCLHDSLLTVVDFLKRFSTEIRHIFLKFYSYHPGK